MHKRCRKKVAILSHRLSFAEFVYFTELETIELITKFKKRYENKSLSLGVIQFVARLVN